jgi:hypothetical protein
VCEGGQRPQGKRHGGRGRWSADQQADGAAQAGERRGLRVDTRYRDTLLPSQTTEPEIHVCDSAGWNIWTALLAWSNRLCHSAVPDATIRQLEPV